jgi:hypothetical protein
VNHRATLTVLLLIAAAASAQTPDRIIIPHGLHFESDVECAVCHDGVESSTSALDGFRPDMDVCADCHDVEDDEACAGCHTDVDTAGEWTPPTPGARRFAHAAHVEAGMDCAACHGDPAVAAPAIPGKTRCRECHETADDYADCRQCHGPDEELLPRDHGAGWTSRHGLEARADRPSCDECHGPSGCLDCHAGDNVRPRTHDLDFVWSHGLEARSHGAECATCHQDPAGCVACHRAEHVMPHNHSRAGWLVPTDGGAHAVEGLFDLESCVACHDAGAADPTCARCHGG